MSAIDPILDPEADYQDFQDDHHGEQQDQDEEDHEDDQRSPNGIVKTNKRRRFDPTGPYRAEIEARTRAGETCTQIAAALCAKGCATTQATIARRRLQWGLRQRDQRIFTPLGPRQDHPPPEERDLAGKSQNRSMYRKEEITRLTEQGKTAEEIAEILKERGVELKAGESTVWRLQTYWKLIPYDARRSKGLGKAAGTHPSTKRTKGPAVSKMKGYVSPAARLAKEAAAERRRDWEAAGRPPRKRQKKTKEDGGHDQGQVEHYPQSCLFGPPPKRRREGGEAEAVDYEFPPQAAQAHNLPSHVDGIAARGLNADTGVALDEPIQIDSDLDSDYDDGAWPLPDDYTQPTDMNINHDTPATRPPVQNSPTSSTIDQQPVPQASASALLLSRSNQTITPTHEQPARFTAQKPKQTRAPRSKRPPSGPLQTTAPMLSAPHHTSSQPAAQSSVRTADIMSAEILIDLARSTFFAASKLKDTLLAIQLQQPVPGSLSALPPSMDDLALARRKVVEAARVVMEVGSE